MDLDQTLAERQARYGTFVEHATCTRRLKKVLRDYMSEANAPYDVQEALDMILHKIGRIACGDPLYADSWHDIAGYAKLVEDRINGVTR